MARVYNFRKASDVVVLEDHADLRLLADILVYREGEQMRNLQSEVDRIKYLEQVNTAYNMVVNLLSAAREQRERYEQQNNQVKNKIAKIVEEYIIYSANWAMQCVRNCCMRKTCLEKLKEQFDALVTEIGELDPNNRGDVVGLTDKVELFKYYMWEYCNTTRSQQARERSWEYSEGLKNEGITMPTLLNRKTSQLGLPGLFEDLEDEQKLEVYMSIIIDSKRADIPEVFSLKKGKFKPGFGDMVSIAVLTVNSSVLVWDVLTTNHNLEPTIRKATSLVGDALEIAVSIAVKESIAFITADMGAVAGFITASVATFVAANIAGFLFSVLSGGLLDFIFGKGGSAPPPDLSSAKFHAAEMPDGLLIARDIFYGKLEK